jgi:hypothetical protein
MRGVFIIDKDQDKIELKQELRRSLKLSLSSFFLSLSLSCCINSSVLKFGVQVLSCIVWLCG